MPTTQVHDWKEFTFHRREHDLEAALPTLESEGWAPFAAYEGDDPSFVVVLCRRRPVLSSKRGGPFPGLDVRIVNILKKGGVDTVAQLRRATQLQLTTMQGMGKPSLTKLLRWMDRNTPPVDETPPLPFPAKAMSEDAKAAERAERKAVAETLPKPKRGRGRPRKARPETEEAAMARIMSDAEADASIDAMASSQYDDDEGFMF
jgi:hypothetical protein